MIKKIGLKFHKDKVSNEMSSHEKVKLYLLLAELYVLNDLSEDAKNTIIEAETIFKGSIEEKAISKSEVKLKIFKK